MTMLLIFLLILGFFSVVMMLTFTISEIQNIRLKNRARDEFVKRRRETITHESDKKFD